MMSSEKLVFDESNGLMLFGQCFKKIGNVAFKTAQNAADLPEAKFEVFENQQNLAILPKFVGVYIMATAKHAEIEWNAQYVGRAGNVSERLSDYSIRKISRFKPNRQAQKVQRNLAISLRNNEHVALWATDCIDVNPCFAALENRILMAFGTKWNGDTGLGAGHCYWCAMSNLYLVKYYDNESMLTTILRNSSTGIGRLLDSQVKVSLTHAFTCCCVDCAFARLQQIFKNETPEANIRGRKIKNEIENFITFNNCESFFSKNESAETT